MSRPRMILSAALLTLFCVLCPAPTSAQQRAYELDACKAAPCAGQEMPLAVAQVRNLQGRHWWRDLEIEVKNVSDKPIYYVRLGVSLPETADGGRVWGVFLRYGRPELIDIALRAESEDVPLRPGESHVFKIPEEVRATFSEQPEHLTRRLRLRIDTVSFGDGTGVEAGGVPAFRTLP